MIKYTNILILILIIVVSIKIKNNIIIMEKYANVMEINEPKPQGTAMESAVSISNSVVNESKIIKDINNDVTNKNTQINTINSNIDTEIENIDVLLDTTNEALTKLRDSL